MTARKDFLIFPAMGFYIDKEYMEQRDWSDKYHDQILDIVGRYLGGCPADIISDTKHGEDYTMCGDVGIAARVRKRASVPDFALDQATLRFTVGREQEFKKLLFNNFKAKYYFYGVADSAGNIVRWVLVKIRVLRNFFLQGAPWLTIGGCADELFFGMNKKTGCKTPNGFIAYDIGAVRVQHPGLVLASSEGHYLPKDNRVRREPFLPMAPSVALNYYSAMASPHRLDWGAEGGPDWLKVNRIPFPADPEARSFATRIMSLCDVRLDTDNHRKMAKKSVALVLECMRDHKIGLYLSKDRNMFNFNVVKNMCLMIDGLEATSPSFRRLKAAFGKDKVGYDGRSFTRENLFKEALGLVDGILCEGV